MRSKRAIETTSNPKLASAGLNPADQPKAPMKQRNTSSGQEPMPVAAKKNVNLSSPGAGEGQNSRCRYCGSDNLAPSFLKRQDARCRTCFKQRYGTARKKNKTLKAAVEAN